MMRLTCRIIVILLFGGVVSALAQWQDLEWKVVEGDTMYTVFQPGEIRAIFEPAFISAAAADEYYHDDEPLLVIADGNDVHAYSTWHLVDHLVVNDRIGGKMIAVTW